MNKFIILLAYFFLLGTGNSVNAQKLPNKQEAGVRAPANVKIDGKATEWGNQLQAYNHATNVYYTIANDDDNLYLVVQATNEDIVNRVVGGGITFTIKTDGKRTDKDGISITYPVTDKKNFLLFNFRGKKGSVQDTTAHGRDSVMRASNKRLGQAVKWLGTTGIPDIDALTSVYNNYGLSAEGRFDRSRVYTCEIRIPLKYLGPSTYKPLKIAYHLIVNGSRLLGGMFYPTEPGMSPELIATFERMNTSNSMMAAPTDFWGEYTLVK